MKASPSQLFKEAETLKNILSGEGLSNSESWQKRQELCHLLESLLLIDLDYALDKKVEQDLWSFVFRNPISACQSKAKEHKKSSHSYSNSQLSTLLETASGFYLQLLQKLCCAYDIDLPCHPRDSVYGFTKEWISRYPVAQQPRKSSLLYICQHCLVHLGDIARYRGQSLQAENFYRHAVDLVPSNGQPYNQLALLEAASGEKLSTVFFYMRSLSVQHPFPLAATNLQNLFSKMSSDGTSPEGKTRMTAFEYITVFLQFHAAIHLNTGFKRAEKMICQLTASLPALIIAEKFETWQLVQMVAVCLFAVEHVWGSLDAEKFANKHDRSVLSPDELKSASLVEELLASMFYAFLLPVHSSPEPKDTAAYYTLPAIKIILDWLLQDPKLLQHEALSKKPQLWHGLCKLLNDLDVVSAEPYDNKKFEDIPLPEDWDLQSFLPLKESQRRLKFSLNSETPSDDESVWLRSVRLCKVGEFLSEEGKERLNVLSLTHVDGHRHFKAVQQTEVMSEQVLQQLQELTVTTTSNGLSTVQLPESSTHLSSSPAAEHPITTIRSKNSHTDGAPQQEVRFKLDDIQQRKQLLDTDRDTLSDKVDRRNKDQVQSSARERRAGKNVAMQAILQQRAAQNSANLHSRSNDIGKELNMLHQDMTVRSQGRSQNHVDVAHHIRSNAENACLPSQAVSEVNMNRIPIRLHPQEQYGHIQAHQQSHTPTASQPCEREQWVPSYNLHQNAITNVAQVIRGNPVTNYIQNTLPHIIQHSTSEFNYHQAPTQQTSPSQQSQQPAMVNKPVAAPPPPPPTFLPNPQNIMWNYMGFVSPYQQNCNGNSNTTGHQIIMSSGANHPQQPAQQQQQQSFYVMNGGLHPKMENAAQPNIATMDAALQSNMIHAYRNSSSNNSSMVPHSSSDLYREQVQEQLNNRAASARMWKSDNNHGAEMIASHLPLSQVVGRAVGQAIQTGIPNQQTQGAGVCNVSSTGPHEMGSNTYSLFNSSWPPGLNMPRNNKEGKHQGTVDPILMQSRIQSLWSGPGPSPLERLLEQQKQRRDSAAQ